MAIVIDVQLKTAGRSTPVDRLIGRLKALEARLDSVNQKLLMMNSLVHSIGNNSAAMRMPSMRGGGGGGRLPAVKAPPIIKPPKAPKAPPTTGQKLRNLIFSTRVGMDASGKMQIAPLVGRLMQLHPALAAAGAALTVFTSTLLTAKNALISFAVNAAVMGGSPTQSAQASRAAKMVGLDPQGATARLRSAIEGGGAGAGFAAQAGINSVGGPFGDNNYSAKLIKALQFIANAPDETTARRRAEGLGLEEAAVAFNFDAKTKAQLGNAGRPQSKEDVAAALRMQVATVTLSSAWERLSVKVMSSVIPSVTRLVEFLTRVADAASNFGKVFGQIQYSFLRIVDLLSQFYDWIAKITSFGGKTSEQKATEENTKAIQNLNRTMDKAFYGGAGRARGALPGGVDGRYLDRNVQAAMSSGIPL